MTLADTIAPPVGSALSRVVGRVTRPWLALVAVCLVLWVPGFFTLPPSDRDEARFAQATRQMLESGDYVRIRNGLVARNQKPIGIYWLQLPFAAAARASGIATSNPIWPYRLPSLLGGLVAVCATYGFGRRLVGGPAALVGAALLAASPLLATEVHIAKTDAALLGATTLAMFVLSRAYVAGRTGEPGVSRPMALLFWAALGLGVLIKGPILPMIAAAAAAALALADARRGAPVWLAALRPRTGLPLLAAIVLPWCIAIGIATHGRFFAQSVGGDLAGKLVGADDAHGGPTGLHLLLWPALGLAGAIAAIAAIPAIWRDRERPQTRVLVAWALPAWLVFELVHTKLPHYTLPLFPPLMLLAAGWLCAPPERPGGFGRAAATLAVMTPAVLGLFAAALPLAVQPTLSRPTVSWPTVSWPTVAWPTLAWAWSGLQGPMRLPQPGLLLGVPTLMVCAFTAWRAARVWPDARAGSVTLLCAAPLLYATLFGLELPHLRALWIAPRVEAALRAHWPHGRPPGAAFAELSFAEPSLMFLCGTDTGILVSMDAALRFVAAGPDHVLLISDTDLRRMDVLLPTWSPGPPVGAGLLRVHAIGTVEGYNYSRGRMLQLMLLSSGP